MDLEQEQSKNEGLEQWFSTYGLITAQRLLSRYNIELPQDLLIAAIKNPLSFYHQLLQIPLKNVLNGIVIQQAYDYHVYVQKLFIDYLLSGESASGEDTQGASTREDLEEERKALIALGEDLHNQELEQDAFIASTQATLIALTSQWNEAMEVISLTIQILLKAENKEHKVREIKLALQTALTKSSLKALNKDDFVLKMNEVLQTKDISSLKDKLISSFEELLVIAGDFDSKYASFSDKLQEISLRSRSFRTQFYDTILRVLDLIKLLPTYKIDPVQDIINREPLYFDKTIGEL